MFGLGIGTIFFTYAKKSVRKIKLLHKKYQFIKASLIGNDVLYSFTCNICGKNNKTPSRYIARELVSCCHCGSTMRYRSIIQSLLDGLGYTNATLDCVMPNKNIQGVGVSDAYDYAIPLANVFNYTNTFYHKNPYLDVTAPNLDRKETLDFIVISDVLEHVCQPVERAFHGLYSMLKPNGVCIITVPCTDDGHEQEHYPELHDFSIEKKADQYILKNKTINNEQQEFNDLVFHGGAGLTLEMRIFSRQSLLQHLTSAGFTLIDVNEQDYPEVGIVWKSDRSVPVVARKIMQAV